MAGAEDSMTRLRDKRRALDAERKRQLIVAIAGRIIAHVDELTALDAAIGDGDHGHNMRRGFEAVCRIWIALEVMGLTDLLKAIGTKLVMKVGGASGPLYGTLFLALGKELPDEPSREEAAAAFSRRSRRSGRAARASGPEDDARRPDSNLSGVFRGRRSAAVKKAARQTRPKRRRRCARSAVVLHSSASDRSVTWIPARGRLR